MGCGGRLALRRLAALDGVPERSGDLESLRVTLGQQVSRRLEARQARGDLSCVEDEVWLHLRLHRDPARALDRARILWAVRREPSDLRWVLKAAVAAGDSEQARVVREWAESRGYRDARWVDSIHPAGGRP